MNVVVAESCNLRLFFAERMAFRSAPWRRFCPEVVSKTIDEALRATIYIVHEAGPTGFVLKQEGETKKLKVLKYHCEKWR